MESVLFLLVLPCFVRPGLGAGALPASSPRCSLPLALSCGQHSVLRRRLRARLAGAVLLWECFRHVAVQIGVLLLGFLFLLLVP